MQRGIFNADKSVKREAKYVIKKEQSYDRRF